MVDDSVVNALLAHQRGEHQADISKRQACRQLLQEIRSALPEGQELDAVALREAIEQLLPTNQIVRTLSRQLTPQSDPSVTQHVDVSGSGNVVNMAGRDLHLPRLQRVSQRPDPAVEPGARVDVAIVTAMPEELEPVLDLLGGRDAWSKFMIDNFIHYKSQLQIGARSLSVVTCFLWKYGGNPTTAAVLRLKPLAPRLIAMTGICAGWESRGVHFGDVIIAERAFHAGEGKQTTSGFQPDSYTYHPPLWLVNWLRDFSFDRDWSAAIRTSRPRSLRYQAMWALCHLAQRTDFPSTEDDWHELEAEQIDWQRVYASLQDNQLITQHSTLTPQAKQLLAQLQQHNYGRLEPIPDPARPRVHYGTFASSDSVISLENPFPEYAQQFRSVRAIDLEVASLFAAAAEIQVPAFAVKGVSDYATADKDDTFHAYAAEASAQWTLAFIRRYAHQLPDK